MASVMYEYTSRLEPATMDSRDATNGAYNIVVPRRWPFVLDRIIPLCWDGSPCV